MSGGSFPRAAPGPEPFFHAGWYGWQNPDWRAAHPDPFAHYRACGRFEGRDPSPMVDMTRFLAKTGGRIAPERAYDAIRGGLANPALGVYRGWSDLTDAQRRFASGAMPLCLRQTPGTRRRFLVFLQFGPQSLHRRWLGGGPRNWDLLVNCYAPGLAPPAEAEYVFCQPGTKFTAMAALMGARAELLLAYEAVWFLDDDIGLAPGLPDRFFEAMARGGVDLAQPGLAPGSHGEWPALFARPDRTGWRRVNAVEIMMPAFSRRALARLGRSFEQSVSGFGLDLLWGGLAAGFDGRVAVHDGLAARHDRAIDERGGAYYRYLRAHGINPKAELWRILTRFETPRGIASTTPPLSRGHGPPSLALAG